MILSELETGLYLDAELQKLLERIFNTQADKLIVIDELHGNDVILVMEQIATSLNPVIRRTVLNKSNQTDYKIKILRYNNMQFAQISNINEEYNTYVITSTDFYNWKNELTKLQKRFFI